MHIAFIEVTFVFLSKFISIVRKAQAGYHTKVIQRGSCNSACALTILNVGEPSEPSGVIWGLFGYYLVAFVFISWSIMLILISNKKYKDLSLSHAALALLIDSFEALAMFLTKLNRVRNRIKLRIPIFMLYHWEKHVYPTAFILLSYSLKLYFLEWYLLALVIYYMLKFVVLGTNWLYHWSYDFTTRLYFLWERLFERAWDKASGECENMTYKIMSWDNKIVTWIWLKFGNGLYMLFQHCIALLLAFVPGLLVCFIFVFMLVLATIITPVLAMLPEYVFLVAKYIKTNVYAIILYILARLFP